MISVPSSKIAVTTESPGTDDDRNVAFNQTVELVRKLRERGVDFEEMVFPDDVHDFLRHENWLRAYAAAADFFDRHLK